MKVTDLNTMSKTDLVTLHTELHRRYMKICRAKTSLVKQTRGLERKSAMKEVIIAQLKAKLSEFTDYEFDDIADEALAMLGDFKVTASPNDVVISLTGK